LPPLLDPVFAGQILEDSELLHQDNEIPRGVLATKVGIQGNQ